MRKLGLFLCISEKIMKEKLKQYVQKKVEVFST